MNVLNQCNLDDLLFAKFAELDQKVAMLKEEMDSIASILERRKRIRDSSITLANQIICEVDRVPKWELRNTSWQSISPQHDEIVEDCMSSLSFSSVMNKKFNGELYDDSRLTDSKQSNSSNIRVANASHTHAHLPFHPYSRPASCGRSLSPIKTTSMRTPMSLLQTTDFQQTIGNPEYLEVLANIDDRKIEYETRRFLNNAEDPPSDPDDSVDDSGRN